MKLKFGENRMNNNVIRVKRSNNKLEIADNRPFFIKEIELLRDVGFALSLVDLDEGGQCKNVRYESLEAFAAEWEFCDTIDYKVKRFDDVVCFYGE